MATELLRIWTVVGELFSATETIDCVRITALNLFEVCVPPGYTTFISTEDAAFNFFLLGNLLTATFAERRQYRWLKRIAPECFFAISCKSVPLTVALDG
jgi:hypothetical protein